MHSAKERRKVAKWLKAKAAYERKHGPPKPKWKSWPIPVVTSVEHPPVNMRFWRHGGTSSAKGKDGSGRSKWFARVQAGKVGFREAA